MRLYLIIGLMAVQAAGLVPQWIKNQASRISRVPGKSARLVRSAMTSEKTKFCQLNRGSIDAYCDWSKQVCVSRKDSPGIFNSHVPCRFADIKKVMEWRVAYKADVKSFKKIECLRDKNIPDTLDEYLVWIKDVPEGQTRCEVDADSSACALVGLRKLITCVGSTDF